MKFELNSLPRNCSDEDVYVEMKRVDALVGKDKLTQTDYNKYAKISSDGVKKRFGSWEKALILAGLSHKYIGTKVSARMRSQDSKNLRNEDILNELRTISKKLDRTYITRDDLRAHSVLISPSIVTYRFGSWVSGVKKAGLNSSPRYKRPFSEKEYLENLLNVWTHYGRRPTFGEMSQTPSLIGPKTYQGHYGSWRKALENFVARMNSEKNETDFEMATATVVSSPKIVERIENRKIKPEDRHSISLSLRYKVLSRDRFRCVRCGRSPATHVGLELHVDHKEPFSKQGKTVLENLETKCRDCNLGKGNRHSE